MKTRTAAFDEAWGNVRTGFPVFRVDFKRRYFNGSAYVLESTAQTIRPKDIESLGAIIQRFDALQAAISISNVTLVLNNPDWVWLPTNITTGKWAPDAIAALGYEPAKSQIVIYSGCTLADGTDELLEMFTGILDDDPKFDSKSGTVTFTAMGQAEQKLKDADAQNVCTSLTNQVTSPANGNSVISLFSAVLKSVWNIFNVRAGGVVKDQGDDQDYTLDDLNDPEIAPGIQFTTSSIPGAVAILWDGKQWYRQKTIGELAALLCTEAGIGAGERVIEDAVFPGVDQSRLQDTAADFVGSTLAGTEMTSYPGRVKHGLDLTASQAGDMVSSGPGTKTFIEYTTDPENSLYQYNNMAVNSDDLDFASVHTLRARLVPGAGTTITKNFVTSTGTDTMDAGIEGPYTLIIELVRTSDNTVRETVTYSKTIASGSKITMVYGQQSYYSPGGGGGTVQNQMLVYVASRSIPPTGTVAFPEMDLTTAPLGWLALASSITLNGGTATVYTKSGTVSGVYDARVALSVGVPASALKRYVVVEVDTTPNAGLTTGPAIDSVTLNWRSSTLYIGSADFTGKTCLEGIQDLAELGGMEYGTKGGGVFYLRNKTVSGTADLVISQKNAVLEILDFSMGYKEVRNVGQVRYGSAGQKGYYFSEYRSTDAAEAEPTSERRFGVRPIKLEISNLVFSQGQAVAEAIAQKLYELNYLPKRRIRAECRLIPHLDVSDKVSLSFHDSPLIERQIFGDPLQTRPAMGATNTLARDILMKVVGKTDDIMRGKSLLDLEEILS